jgi:hypothetical protein
MKKLFTATLVALLCVQALAADTRLPTAPPPHVLKSWVHIIGCPASTHRKKGPEHVILIFSDGEAVVLRIDTATDEKRDILVKFIGSIEGTDIMYNCGTQA